MNKPLKISLLSTFESFDLSVKNSLADIKQPLLLSLATLALAEDYAKRNTLSSEQIVAALEAAGVAIKKNQIKGALSRAGDKVSTKVVSGEVYYRLMTKGRRQIEPLLNIGPIQVVYIKSNTPATSRKHLRDILSSLPTGTRICDPYYGLRSLESLLEIPITSNIMFLTSKTSEKAITLSGPLTDFKRERPNIEIRISSSPKSLHDRYILTLDNVFLLGQGIKDIGDKESFIVLISNLYASDLLNDLKIRFDSLWLAATKI